MHGERWEIFSTPISYGLAVHVVFIQTNPMSFSIKIDENRIPDNEHCARNALNTIFEKFNICLVPI